ncbi:MAG: chitobiase/beta-hexosaminidase C-terminal domain-containing protein [bacterium]|nr:chitobiase/beta-hexosaminidase C-terminal domain-containing protein [bacterium]MDY4100418.1 chitobiase/beta-hexosaminidase C-terminal domain-containing protein [Lachnospiraceae bacterium]
MCEELQKVKQMGKSWWMFLFSFMIVGAIFIHAVEVKASTTDFTGWTAISTAEELQKLSYNSESSRFYLTNDIDMSRYGYWETIKTFKGTFDGNGHCIKNLKSTTGGLFGDLYPGATIRNLRLEDVDIRTSNIERVGVLAGRSNFADNDADERAVVESLVSAGAYYKDAAGTNQVMFQPITISKCFVSGNVYCKRVYDSQAGQMFVGGILGQGRGTSHHTIGESWYKVDPVVTIEECINSASLMIEGSVSRADGVGVGGIVGWQTDNFTVRNCMNYGEINVDEYSWWDDSIGGIIGDSRGQISNCYSVVDIGDCFDEDEESDIGTVVGYAAERAVINGCYYFGGGEGRIESLFKPTKISRYDRSNKSSYSGWDFDRVWTVDPGINDGYPILQWYLPYVEIEAPTANMQSGSYSKEFSVELTSHLNNAKIYYTTDGTKPSASAKLYTGSIPISQTTTLKAIAILDNGSVSPVSTYEYKFACAAPTANYKSGKSFSEPAKIKLSTKEKGATIYYTTNGKNPTKKSKMYQGTITLYKDTQIKAMAVTSGKSNSEVASWNYYVSAKTPQANKPSGTYSSAVNVKLSCKTKGAKIYYTTNGKTPTAKSKQYKGAFTISKNTTLKVIAINKNVKSRITTYNYHVKVETPFSNKTEGNYKQGVTVRLGCKTKGATIYYTTDGSYPSIYSKRYTGSIRLNQSTTIKAIAVKDGMEDSSLFTADYYIYQ